MDVEDFMQKDFCSLGLGINSSLALPNSHFLLSNFYIKVPFDNECAKFKSRNIFVIGGFKLDFGMD